MVSPLSFLFHVEECAAGELEENEIHHEKMPSLKAIRGVYNLYSLTHENFGILHFNIVIITT